MKLNKLNLIGWFFLIYGIFIILALLYFKTYEKILWFCYIGLIIMGLAILKRNSYWLGSQMNILLTPTILWSIDIIYYYLTGNFLISVSSQFLTYETSIQQFIALEHLIIPPLSFYALYKIKIQNSSFWKISIIQLFLFFIVSRILTSPLTNVNCAFTTCLPFNFTTPYYISWFIIMVPPTIITHLILTSIKSFKKNE